MMRDDGSRNIHPLALRDYRFFWIARFFAVVGLLRMPATSLLVRSVVQRDQVDVKVLWRESGSLQ